LCADGRAENVPQSTAGNPINVATGNKTQTEVDFVAGGASSLAFRRYYASVRSSATDLGLSWRHNYSARLRPEYLPPPEMHTNAPTQSRRLPSPQAACEQGFEDIRAELTAQFGGDAVARYEGGQCKVYAQGRPLGTVPVRSTLGQPALLRFDYSGAPVAGFFDSDNPSDGATGPIAWHAERPEGGSVRFHHQTGTVWASQADEVYKLEEEQDGFMLRLPDGGVERYDSTGRLVAISEPGGATQTLVYDGNGRLVTVTDHYGRTLTFSYGGARISSITGPGAEQFTYSYNGVGNLVTVSGPEGAERRYVYEDSRFPHALTGIIDENGARFATFAYDNQGRGISTEHAGGVGRNTLVFNADGSTTITDALDAVRTYRFERILGVNRIKQVDGPGCASCGGSTRSVTYDDYGQPFETSNARDVVTRQTYLSIGNRWLMTDRNEAWTRGEGRLTRFTWHPTFHLPTCVNLDHRHSTEYVYNDTGALLRKTITDVTSGALFPNYLYQTCASIAQSSSGGHYNQRSWAYTYNSAGQLTSVDGPRNDVADTHTYTYDAQGNLSQITNALGHITRITAHDALGRPLSITDPNGLVTQLAYDARGRIISRQVGGELTTFDYDPVGNLKRLTLPDGSYLVLTHDDAHRVTKLTDQGGNEIVYTLDAAGNIIKEQVKDAGGVLVRTHQRVFDELSQLRQSIGAQNQTATYEYDTNGNPILATDPLTHSTASAFDALDRLMQITDAKQGVTKLGYNSQDHLTSVTDPRGLTTSYEYDGLGNLTKEISPDRSVTTYTHDAAGNVLTKTDARGMTSRYTYDALNRLTTATHADGSTETYTYDTGTYGIGRLTQVTDSTGSVDYRYDVLGRLTSKVQKVGTKTFTTSYTYDAQGRLATLTYPSGMSVGYAYSAGRVTSLTVNGTPLLTGIIYEPFGPVSGWTFGNGAAFDRSFDLDGRIQSQTFGTGTRSYTFDAASRLTKFTDPTHNLTFTYDVLDRLIKSTGTFGRTYDYDANGNRVLDKKGTTQTDYVTEATSNRLLSTTSAAVTKARVYDEAGNTLNDGTYAYVYDARGRLIESRNASDAVIGSYKVNALGQRVYKKKGSAVTHFVYDEAGHLIGEYNGAGALVQETVYLGDIPVGVWKAGVLYFIHADHLNTPRAILDAANRVIWLWKAEPFGSQAATQDPDGDGVKFFYNLRFPGQYFDSETGLFYNYFRDYDPRIGRYSTSDPIGLAAGLNTYAYVGANPLSFSDPLGLEKLILMNTNSMVTSEAVMAATAKSYPDQKGVMMVFGHANSERIADDRQGGLLFNNRTYLTPEDLAIILKNDPGWSDNMPVVLMACETAKGENSFAQRLSEILKTRVTGFPEKISWVSHAPRPNNPIVFEPRN